MKINFLGSFETVQQGLRYEREDAVQPTKEDLSSFDSLLGLASKTGPKKEKIQKKDISLLSEVTPHEVMARLSAELRKSPGLQTAVREAPLQPLIPERVKEAIAPLAPPSIVSIKRYDSPSEFDRLPRQDRVAEVERLITSANRQQGADIPVPLALAVVSTESSFRARSISQDGHATKGLFQFLDSTGREILSQFGSEGPYSPLNPEQNVNLGIRYLDHLKGIFSRPTPLNNGMQTVPGIDGNSRKKMALAAFNAGPGRVATAQARALDAQLNPGDYEHVKRFLPASTRDYVSKVLFQEREFEMGRALLSNEADNGS